MNSRLFVCSLLLLVAPSLASSQTVIPAATNGGSFSASSAEPTSYILNALTSRTQTGSTTMVDFGTAGTVGTYTLTINGSLEQTGTGRGVRTVAVSASGLTFNLNVGAAGLVRTTGDDGVQGRISGAGSFSFNVNNQGTIYSGPTIGATPITPISSGRAINLVTATGGTITNGSVVNTGALLRADGADAVRLGSNMIMDNYGIVLGNSVVNDSSANNIFNAPPNDSTAEARSTSEGVSFEEGANSTLNNYGSISGSRHGVESAEIAANVTVNNFAGGVIVGRNGSGLGFDANSASASNVTIVNNGEIRGDYAGVGNIIDRTGNPSFTNDGDGDGIDVDGAATITNNSLIHSTGAGGFDTGGRANSAEGIAIGGGVITNNSGGIIRGANRGILSNNDANLDRSALAATTITNAGTIEGQNGFGIRLEGNFADTITNSGIIIGTGAIPDPSATVLRQNGIADPANGTLDGVVYGAGSARFIRGDGSAIQMGEGNDTLNHSGTINGSANGRAVNMEGGADVMNITGGSASISGEVNGGAGSDTLSITPGTGNTFNASSTFKNFETINLQTGTTVLSSSLAGNGNGSVSVKNAAELRIAGAGNAGDVVVESGGRLSGTGAAAAITLEDGAALAPGNSPGTLNGTDLLWNAGADLIFELGSTSDRLLLSGTLDKNGTGTFEFVFSDAGGLALGTYDLITFASTDFILSDFTFTSLAPGLDGDFTLSGTQLSFEVTTVPEPSVFGLIGFALVLTQLKRRRG